MIIMAIDPEQKAQEEALDREAVSLRQRKSRITNRFKKLRSSDSRHFQSDFVKLQAHEICNYLKDMQMSPLKAWYDELFERVSEASFMEKFYLTFNEYNEVVPDTKRIKGLILPEPPTEGEERNVDSLDFK
jgi:hypothetical protein